MAGFKQAFSLEGLVVALVGGAAWTIASGFLAGLTDFRLGPSISVGAGVGMGSAAVFLWRAVIPKRKRDTDTARSRRLATKKQFREEAEYGRNLAGSDDDYLVAEAREKWEHDTYGLIDDHFGQEKARWFRGRVLDKFNDRLQRFQRLIEDFDSLWGQQ
jgi:hypothetical protein